MNDGFIELLRRSPKYGSALAGPISKPASTLGGDWDVDRILQRKMNPPSAFDDKTPLEVYNEKMAA
jgi:hypothetical protein